jgi:hypothetical protein
MDFFTSGLPVVTEGFKNKSDDTGAHYYLLLQINIKQNCGIILCI